MSSFRREEIIIEAIATIIIKRSLDLACYFTGTLLALWVFF